MAQLIEIHRLTLNLPQTAGPPAHPILENQSLSLQEGERIALVGPSGSGKTLFLRSVCLLEQAASGEFKWRGKAISPAEIPFYRSRVTYVGQRSILSPGTVETAFEEVFRFRVHQEKKWDREWAQTVFRLFGKTDDFLLKRIHHLSGGERQLVFLVRAVSLQPEILCLDEPTSALDRESVEKVEAWLKADYKGAWIWVTHHLEQAERVGTRKLVLSRRSNGAEL